MCTIKNKIQFSNNVVKNKGFSIIETAIVIAILGLILSAILMPYNLWNKNKTAQITDTNISLTTQAVTNFLLQRGRYPCPARLDAARTDVDYGMEAVCDNSDITYPTIANPGGATVAGTFANGFYYEESRRNDADIDPDPDPNPAPAGGFDPITPVIRRGSVPFRTLGLEEDQVEDGYGMRLQYAITENLAVNATYVQTSGGIRIQDGNNNSLTRIADSAHYVIFSTGKDLKGAFTRDGIRVLDCGLAGLVGLDVENCNTEGGGINRFADYIHANYSLADGAVYYDDYLKFYSSVETPLWRVADPMGLHIRDLIAVELGGGAGVGIGVSNPTDSLHVAGKVRAESGNSMVDNLCDESGADCFSNDNFGSVLGHIDYQCAGTTYGTGFSIDRINCTNTTSIKCPLGTRLMGIKPDGNLQCGNFTGCPSQNITLCTTNIINLPPSIPDSWPNLGGTPIGWTVVFGSSYRERWRCNSSGSWSRSDTDGVCVCTPSSFTNTVSCNSRRPGNWIGDIIVQTTTVCPSGDTTTTELSDNCVCDPLTNNSTKSCPSGFSGSIPTENEWVCSDPNNGSWSGWQSVLTAANPTELSYCTCTATTETKNISCPSGQVGGIKETRDFDCGTGLWTPWYVAVPTDDTCVCDPTRPPNSGTIGCTAPLVGTINQLQDWNCALNGGNGGWDPWYEVSNDCGAVTYSYRDKSTPNGPLPGSLPIKLGQTCGVPGIEVPCSSPAGSGKSWYYPLCECE